MSVDASRPFFRPWLRLRASRLVSMRAMFSLLTLLCVGCDPGPKLPAKRPDPAITPAAEFLARTLKGYASVARHRESSTLTLAYTAPGESSRAGASSRSTERTQFRLDFARPNRLRCAIERENNTLLIVSDARQLWVSVEDPATQNLGHQVVQRDAPPQLAVGELYAATELLDPAKPHQMLSLLLSLPVNLQLIPLGWLTGDTIVLRTLQDPSQVTELATEAIRQTVCRRFQVTTASGTFVYWVDPDRLRVLRVDLPTGELFAELPLASRPTELQLTWQVDAVDGVSRGGDSHASDLNASVVEEGEVPDDKSFETAGQGGSVPDPFTFAPSPQAELMQYFVLPPQAQAHSQLGKPIPAMTFTRSDGSQESSADWAGRTAVLVWVDDQSASQRILPLIESVAPLYNRRSPAVVFRAIHVGASPGPAAATDDNLAAEAVPELFDRAASGRDTLQIAEAPTLVILNPRQELSWYEVGANPQVDQLLMQILEQLKSGQDLAKDVQAAAELDRVRYEQQLTLARRPVFSSDAQRSDRTAAALPAEGLAKAAPFKSLAMTQVWQSAEAKEPGALLAIPPREGHDAHLIVLNEMRELLRLRLTGEVLDRRTPNFSPASYVTELRTAVDRLGRRWFAAFTPMGRHVEIFDERLQRLAQYPPDKERRAGIFDVQLEDLDGDGTLDAYVAFADPEGCHRVDLQGRLIWSRRVFPTVASLAVQRLAHPPHLLVTGEPGTLLPIGADGATGTPLTVGSRTIHQLFAAGTTDQRPTQMLGLCYTVEGRLIAVGMDAKLNEVWSYGLPGGVYRKPLQIAQWVADGDGTSGFWILAGPDGSLHIVGDDGQRHDMCAFGTELLGVAAHPSDSGLRLYIATAGQVVAYDVK